MKRSVIIVLLLASTVVLQANEIKLPVFKTCGKSLPYPEYSDRAGWDVFFGENKDWIIRKGEEYLDAKFSYIPPSVYLAFEKTGDRSSFRADYFARESLEALVMAELAEGKGRFIPKMIDAVWYFSEKISWVHPQHAKKKSTGRSLGDPGEEIIGITSSFTGVDMSYAYRFFHEEWDKVDPSISMAVRNSLNTHIFKPFMDERLDAANWWLGFDANIAIINWCPWINFDVMLCYFLVNEDAAAIDAALRRSIRSMDKYLNYVRKDGGCDEGPSYWQEATGKVYDYAYLLKLASGGAIDKLSHPRLRLMGEYKTNSYIGGGWIVNYADGFGRDNGNANFLYRFGKDVGSRAMMDYALTNCVPTPSGDIFNKFECMRYRDAMIAEQKAAFDAAGGREEFTGKVEANLAEHWYPEHEMAFMRRGKWFFSALAYNNYSGGKRNDTHNHNDIGSCVLFYDGMPVLIDVGKATPVDGTYDAARYSFWHIRSDYHNVPTVNGKIQTQGDGVMAHGTVCDLKAGTFSTDIAGAYPAEAGVKSWKRSFRFSKNGLKIEDRYSLASRTAPDDIHFMVRGKVREVRKGELEISVRDFEAAREGVVRVKYPSTLKFREEVMNLDDREFIKVWGRRISRLVFESAPDAPLSGDYKFEFYVR